MGVNGAHSHHHPHPRVLLKHSHISPVVPLFGCLFVGWLIVCNGNDFHSFVFDFEIVMPSNFGFSFNSLGADGSRGCNECGTFVKLAGADKRRAWPSTSTLSHSECNNPLLWQLLVLIFIAIATCGISQEIG